MRRPILNLVVLVIILTLSFSFIAVLPAASQDNDEIISKLRTLRGMVEREHPCLANKVNAVIHQIEAGAFHGALNKLENDVKKSINAWIKDPEFRQELLELVDEIIDLIHGITPPPPPTPDFEISAYPEKLEIMQNSSGMSTIKVKSLHGFSQRVNLSAELTPATDKVTLALDPTWVIPTPKGNTSTLTVSVAADAEEDEYVITVTGTNSTLPHSVNITLVVTAIPIPPFKDFSIEASPTSLTIQQGDSDISVITITSLKGFSQPVDLAITSQSIPNVSTTLYPLQVFPKSNNPAISILTIDVASVATPGSYSITVNGTSGSLWHSVNIVLKVTAPPVVPTPEFAIAASPTSLTIQQGDSDKSTIIIVSLNGFNKPVDLAITSAKITGVVASLDPLQVTPPPNSFATSILKVDVATNASLGSYTITVTGTSDSLTNSTNVSLVVTALPPPPPSAPDFEITAVPSELEIVQGSFATSTIIITSKNGFSQLVDLAVTSDPITGVTTTLNPLQVTPAANSFAISVLRVDVATDAPIGSHIITVTGESDSITKSQNISLEVTAPTPPPPPIPPTPNFTIVASPTTLTVEQGESATSTIIVVSLNGFSQPVDLNVTSESIENVSLILEPSQVTPEPNGFATSTLAIEIEIDASPDEHIITVTGTSDALEHSVNVSLKVVVEKTPPVIVSVLRQPEKPSYNETATVLASVIDVGSGVKKVILSYSGGTTWKNETMTLKEELYRAIVPAFPFNITINYRVYASDNVENWAAPSSIYSYVVADPYPPDIGYPNWSPEKPAANEEITITVTVTEPPHSSGVKDVTLWYVNQTRDLWLSVPMTENGYGNWMATITNQSDTVVTFFIEAIDNAENMAESEEQEFTVAAPPGVPLAWILAAIAIIGAGTGGGIYYWRRRRKKSRGITVS